MANAAARRAGPASGASTPLSAASSRASSSSAPTSRAQTPRRGSFGSTATGEMNCRTADITRCFQIQ